MLLLQSLNLHLKQVFSSTSRPSGPARLLDGIILLVVLMHIPWPAVSTEVRDCDVIVDALADYALDLVHIKWAILVILGSPLKELDPVDWMEGMSC